MDLSQINWSSILAVIGLLIGIGLVLVVLFAVWVFWRVKKIYLPAGANFFTALRATPISVVILLDLLDFSLDIFSAPISWVILGKLGLAPLRTVTMIEALIPGTEILPTMTLAWIIARIWPNLRIPTSPDSLRSLPDPVDRDFRH